MCKKKNLYNSKPIFFFYNTDYGKMLKYREKYRSTDISVDLYWRPVVPLHSETSVKVWLCLMEVQLEEHCSSPVLKWQGPGQEDKKEGPANMYICMQNYTVHHK